MASFLEFLPIHRCDLPFGLLAEMVAIVSAELINQSILVVAVPIVDSLPRTLRDAVDFCRVASYGALWLPLESNPVPS